MGIEEMGDFEELEIQDRLEDISEFEHSLENSQGLENLDETHIRRTERLEEGIYRDTIGSFGMPAEMDSLENELISGEPLEDLEHWHMQEGDMSCAVVCQEFVAEELLDTELNEQDLVEFAVSKGWFDPETGTTLEDTGNILEYLGLEVMQNEHGSIEDIERTLEEGGKVIAGVNNISLLTPDSMESIFYPSLTANHAVEVIGIDRTDPSNVKVILNDPGLPGGRGITYDLEEFQTAWNTSGGFMVSAYRSDK